MWNLSHSHQMREHIDPSFLSKISKTGWLSKVENCIQKSSAVAQILMKGSANVLVYCQLGNSGTPVITALAQIFCDPYYRTFDGFRTLIHKEFSYYLYNFQKKGFVLLPEQT